MTFDRSEMMKGLHSNSKQRIELYESKYGSIKDNNLKYSDFTSNKNPIDDKIKVYNVSYQLSYSNGDNSLEVIQRGQSHFNTHTFRVAVIDEGLSVGEITDKIKESINEMYFTGTNQKFTTAQFKGLTESVGSHYEVDVNEGSMFHPIGIEESTDIHKSRMYEKIESEGMYIENLDSEVIVVKNNKHKYKAKLGGDLSTYM